jgi:hypothetical protein
VPTLQRRRGHGGLTHRHIRGAPAAFAHPTGPGIRSKTGAPCVPVPGCPSHSYGLASHSRHVTVPMTFSSHWRLRGFCHSKAISTGDVGDAMNAREKTTGLSRLPGHAALCLFAGLFAVLAMFGQTSRAVAQQAAQQAERFEVASIKAVRPALVDTIAALQKGDVAAARTAFETYDSLWNGIEVYVNVRSKDFYDTLEHGFQARIEKGLGAWRRTLRRCCRRRRRCWPGMTKRSTRIEGAAPQSALRRYRPPAHCPGSPARSGPGPQRRKFR